MDIGEWIGTFAGILSIVAFFPQIRETYKNPEEAGLSIGMCLINFVSLFLWSWYAILLNSISMLVTEVIMLLCCGALCVLCFRRR
ncbi:MAG: hypothetical protein LBJ70_00605 [Holosporales bacterium]|nr:hypothetical protein [Holosporales bacterium]